MNRAHLPTEQRLPSSMQLDTMDVEQAVAVMGAADEAAVAAVAAQRINIASAIMIVGNALSNGGRLIYVGAGTSGRLGVLDAAECPPTFGTSPHMVQAIIAGGEGAMFRSAEGAEDDAGAGAAAVDGRAVVPGDVVMGIAAGGTTPFVHGALRRAAALGAQTIFLSCVNPGPDDPPVDLLINPLTGPEVLTGSTRLKAGTATKLVLNTISTLSMVRLGKVYQNLMVDLRATNAKLRDRAARIISSVTGVPRERAEELLHQAEGHVKLAIVMQERGIGLKEAAELLEEQGGDLRKAINR